MAKTFILVGQTRKGCFQRTFLSFLDAIKYAKRRNVRKNYLVGCRLYEFLDGHYSGVYPVDSEIWDFAKPKRVSNIEVISEVSNSDDLPF